VTHEQLHLRRILPKNELASARALAREFGDWASEQVRAQLGIAIPANADHPTAVLDDLLESEDGSTSPRSTANPRASAASND